MSDVYAAYENAAFDKETGEPSVTIPVDYQERQAKERLTYSWENLNVFAPILKGRFKKKKVSERHILRNVSGICRPGELLAVMGASGAGKTTLLNCLNFRSDVSLKIKGKLYINGQRVTPDLLTSRSAYVQQEDIFVGTITVKEQLVFQANLRMDKHLSKRDRMQKVDDVMMEMNLVHCADTYIGIPGRLKGISGGEKKRLAFACEVLTDPPLLFCDEPTTGLESSMAQDIVEVMNGLVKKGKTIISTIHQPSSEVFAMFNRVLLLAEGRTAYLGSADGAIMFFASMGKVIPPKFNPADFFIGLLAIQPDKEEECKQYDEEVSDFFESSSIGQEVKDKVKENSMGCKDGSPGQVGNFIEMAKPSDKADWGSQFTTVLKRSCLAKARDRTFLWIKFIQMVIVSLFVGLIFLDQNYDTTGSQNINGAMFLILAQLSFSTCFSVIRSFCMDLPLFLREHFNGIYRADVYFLAKNLTELPIHIIQPVVFGCISYYMIGLNPPAENFFIHVGLLILANNTAASFGFLISCLAKDLQGAIGMTVPLLMPLMMNGGIFINISYFPIYFVWLKYCSWFFYGFEGLAINQWNDVTNITTTILPGNPTGSIDGVDIIEQFGFYPDHLGFDIGLLFTLLVGFRILAFLFLLRKTSRKVVKSYE